MARKNFLPPCSGSTYIELRHIVQTQAGQAAVRGVPVAAAAVNIDDPIPMPDREILVRSSGEKYCGCVADNTDGVRAGTDAIQLYSAPDAGVGIVTWETVNQVKVPAADCNFQACLLYTSPSPRDRQKSRMPSSA